MTARSVLLCFVFAVFANGATADRTITLVADKWCPFNCSDDTDNRGILVERAATALAVEGFRVDYIEMPWSRAIIGVREGKYDAIVGAGPTETPDFHFSPHPLATARHRVYTLASSDWEYRGIESLAEIRLGVIQDYSYGGLNEAYIQPNRDIRLRLAILKGNQVLPRLIRMLELGRIDALVAEERVLNYYFAFQGQTNPLKHSGLVNEEGLYVAFSPALENGRELAEIVGRGRAEPKQAP